MLFVMYESMVFSSVLVSVEGSEMGLYEEPKLLFCYGMGMMLASFHMCGMMLVLRTNVYS